MRFTLDFFSHCSTAQETHTFSDQNYISASKLTNNDVLVSYGVSNGVLTCYTAKESSSNLIPIGQTDLLQLTYTSGIDRLTKYICLEVESIIPFESEYGTAPSDIIGTMPNQAIILPQATASMLEAADAADRTFAGWFDGTSTRAPGSSFTPFSDISHSCHLFDAQF